MQQPHELAEVTIVLAHGSDPVAVFGFFGPALLLVALVAGLVWRDRRASRQDGEVERAAERRGPTPPPAG